MKHCERCNNEIPEEFVNELCLGCYTKVEEEREEAKKRDLEEAEARKTPEEKQEEKEGKESFVPVQGICDPTYKTNPEAPDKEQWEANINLFKRNGVLLYKPTRLMYTVIKNYLLDRVRNHPQYAKFIWKPKVVDVGCGSGVGSNVISQEADFVWGIDKNETSVRFAKEAFTRDKNGIYYSSQVTFDQIDLMHDTRGERDFAKFDVVVAIEIIEHVEDAEGFLERLITFFDKKKAGEIEGTTYFISTPNRNNDHIKNEGPSNPYHVREWTSEEFYSLLAKFFPYIELYNAAGESVDIHTNHTPILAKCHF